MDEEQRVDRGEVVSSGTVVAVNDELGCFFQGIFLRGSQPEERRVLLSVGGHVVVPNEVLSRLRLLTNDRKQFDRTPLPERLVHPELEDPSSGRTEIRGALEEIVKEELITNLIFHVAVPDYLKYVSRGDPLLTYGARRWRGFCDHDRVGGLVTFWKLEGVSQALACHLLD